MISEMILSPEGLATDVTGEGSLVGVGSLVYQQIVGLGELALAEAADELLLPSLATDRFLGVGRHDRRRLVRHAVLVVVVVVVMMTKQVLMRVWHFDQIAKLWLDVLVGLGGCSCQVGKVEALLCWLLLFFRFMAERLSRGARGGGAGWRDHRGQRGRWW